MTRRLLTILSAGALAAAPAFASAQTTPVISVSGGAVAATGTLGDATDLGYHAAAGLNFGGTRVPVGLRFEGGFNGLGVKNGVDANYRILSATANAVFNLSQTPDSPYIIGGLGAYNTRLSGSGAFGNSTSRNNVGINVGGGLRFPLAGLSTFFEARYHSTLGREGSNLQFIPITFGIMF